MFDKMRVHCSLLLVITFILNYITLSPGLELEVVEAPSNNLVNNTQKEKEVVEKKNDEIKNEICYDPTWDSLDNRPLPSWYDEDKIGIFIHWGVYSVPGFGSEWFWLNFKSGRGNKTVQFMKDNYPQNFTYQEFAPSFKAEFYDPKAWADIFQRAGARYVVLTSKHHEGYTMWPSKYSFSWNVMDVGPKRDLVGELAGAIRANTSIKFGLYHSLYEWYNPLWMNDKANNFSTNEFVRFKIQPELHDIVNTYRPEIVWSDGEWEASDAYWESKEFLAWLYNESPVRDTVVTNDRWGGDTLCKHGGYYTCADRYNPGELQSHKWENCFTIDRKSWGYRRNAVFDDYLTPDELIRTIVESVACGGNVLVNIGPTKEGTLPPIMVERLLQMGEWLEVNGDAIYKTVPWTVQNDTLTAGVWYTAKPLEKKVFAIATRKDTLEFTLKLASVDSDLVDYIELLGTEGQLQWEPNDSGISISLPNLSVNKSKWAWTFVISTK